MKKLRKFQDEAFQKWKEVTSAGNKDFLLCASVGAGKTYIACHIAKDFLKQESKRQIIVVTNGRSLVRAWAKTAAALGVKLKESTSNAELEDGLPEDADGYIITYAALGTWPDLHESLISKRETLVILDEIHHLGEEEELGKSVWGDAAKQAFHKVALRLALSGTPFRSKGKKIPFVTYIQVDGDPETFELKADYVYSYGQAVADGVCRSVIFHPYHGLIKYRIDTLNFEYTFLDKVSPFHQSERLRNFNRIIRTNELFTAEIKEANECLFSLRDNGDPVAGGIIIANDLVHAKTLAEFLYDITGVKAVLILSDDDDAQLKLEQFKKGIAPWLIAVRMVSEGVDIPRLRVMVYCSRITEELFFTQALGRIVRTGYTYGPAHFYMPGDERFLVFAKKIEEEIRIAIEEKKKKEGGGGTNGSSLFDREFIAANGEQGLNITGGLEFESISIKEAEEFRYKSEILRGVSTIDIVNLVQMIRQPTVDTTNEPELRTYSDENDEKRHKVSKTLRQFCIRTGEENYGRAWGILQKRVGVSEQRTATNAQLDEMYQLLLEDIRNLKREARAARGKDLPWN